MMAALPCPIVSPFWIATCVSTSHWVPIFTLRFSLLMSVRICALFPVSSQFNSCLSIVYGIYDLKARLFSDTPGLLGAGISAVCLSQKIHARNDMAKSCTQFDAIKSEYQLHRIETLRWKSLFATLPHSSPLPWFFTDPFLQLCLDVSIYMGYLRIPMLTKNFSPVTPSTQSNLFPILICFFLIPNAGSRTDFRTTFPKRYF